MKKKAVRFMSVALSIALMLGLTSVGSAVDDYPGSREALNNCAIGAACNRKYEDLGWFSTIFLSKGIEPHTIPPVFL